MNYTRRTHAVIILATIVTIASNVLCVCAQFPNGLEGTMEVSPPPPRRGFPAEVDLYVKPETKPHPLKKAFPELFTTEAVVVTFSAPWCGACRRQALELRGPSERWNILRVKIEETNKETGETVKTKWDRLMDKLELGDIVPVTIVVSKGEVLKVFHGYTPWATIKPHAEKAKKNDNETDDIDIGPIHIDWDDGLNIDWRRNRRPLRP